MTSDTPDQPRHEEDSWDRQDGNGLADDTLRSQHLDVDALSAYLDQQLEPAELAAARDHLASCPECARELAELRATVALLRHLPQYAARRSFQLGPEHARRARSAGRTGGVDLAEWFERLLPIVPALRIATVGVAVLLIAVIAGDLVINRGAGNAGMVPVERALFEREPVDQAAPIAGDDAEGGEAPPPMAAMPEESVQARSAFFQPTVIATDETAIFAESADETGTEPEAPASMVENNATGEPGAVVAREPAAEPASSTPSGWRLLQVGLGLALVWLIVSLVGIARIRRERSS